MTRAYEVAQTLRESLSRAPWLLGYKVQGERALAELERLAGEAEGLRAVVDAARDLYAVVERDESVGICLSDRVAALLLRDALAALEGAE